MKAIEVFDYLDYREYLLAWFNATKQKNSRYSLRSFSNRLGFKSKDFIYRIMRNEKSLSPTSITQITIGLGLNLHESLFFEAIVLYCQATSEDERNKYLLRVQAQQKAAKFSKSQATIHAYQYDYYAHWHHSAIRSLIGMHGFNGDYKTLGAKLCPKISAVKVQQSVELLLRLGFVSKQIDGTWILTSPAISSGDYVSLSAIQNFHTECLALASNSIESLPPPELNISGVTLGISANKFHQIVDRINSFRKEIAMMTDDDPGADRVYQLNLQLFPMSNPIE